MKVKSTILVLCFGWLLTNAAYASSFSMINSIAYELERATKTIHAYLHSNYTAGYGAHELENAASQMHHSIHEWDLGEIRTSDLAEKKKQLRDTWKAFNQSIGTAGLVNNGDATLRKAIYQVNNSYGRLSHLLRRLE